MPSRHGRPIAARATSRWNEFVPMKDQLAQVEKRLQSLVEDSLSRLAGGKLSPAAVANQLAAAMIAGLGWGGDAPAGAPDQYAIALHPKDVESLIEQAPDLGADLSTALLEVARESGYAMPTAPHATLAAAPPPHAVVPGPFPFFPAPCPSPARAAPASSFSIWARPAVPWSTGTKSTS